MFERTARIIHGWNTGNIPKEISWGTSSEIPG